MLKKPHLELGSQNTRDGRINDIDIQFRFLDKVWDRPEIEGSASHLDVVSSRESKGRDCLHVADGTHLEGSA